LLSSWVARLVIQPTALHCTSTLGEFICLMSGARPPSVTMATLFSAVRSQQYSLAGVGADQLLTAKFPSAALAARCTSMSGFWRRNRMGSRVSRSTSLTSASCGQLPAVVVLQDAGTSFCNLGEGQARRPLQIDVV
jgi:hypothetical protein